MAAILCLNHLPRMKVRTSRKNINEKVMRCIVQCLSETTVSTSQVCKIIANVANMIFDQEWEVPAKVKATSEKNEESEHGQIEEDEEDDLDIVKDYTYTLPACSTILQYLEDAAVLSLKHVAETIIDEEEASTITIGLDDTTKAAGHRLYDVKTDHITIKTAEGVRSFMTTGYIENSSHTGKVSASTYEHQLKCLSVLADCTVKEIKEHISFWMSDRGSELDTMLDELGIESEKRLKCCAHVILGIDNAIDKVFKNTEQSIGVNKLLQLEAGDKAFTPSNSSVHTLGLIALSKLLSPSHASHSISLYNEYKQWLDQNEHDLGKDFLVFTSNRFGRTAELSKMFLKHKPFIGQYFDDVVDINSNKLVLAVSAYITNEWFAECCQLYSKMGDSVIFPLMDFLGIDAKKGDKRENRNWESAKLFFDTSIVPRTYPLTP